MKQTVLILAALPLLAACDPAAKPDAAEDQCGASGFQGLMGQPRTALDQLVLPDGTRVVGPDDMVTADYRTDRLNIEYDRKGVIHKIGCY
ncbi:I78 family peptidase inhibitor [Paracoccus sp. JM45]|uniref:I78 family peptidase inhibitor n=1 Tax=Paracoccus sp. JM45 TaxID=2283626 RepID=UPI000E6CF4B2|nr:I78 family peptidase inhibitor [Paracoccus sp. JM45]RJE80415.1 hypothetical protein DWB67_05935 [Paracoccus sp. JM45]